MRDDWLSAFKAGASVVFRHGFYTISFSKVSSLTCPKTGTSTDLRKNN